MQLELAILVGVVGAQIPDLTGAGLVGSEGDAEFGTLDGVAGDAVDLIDCQGRLGSSGNWTVPIRFGNSSVTDAPSLCR